MASFSFGAGNAAKLVRIPLYAAGRLATLLIPRARDTWVFGCGAGVGDGALALWREVAAHHHTALWLTGSDREAADAAALGIPTVPKHSVRGFWRTARAQVIVVTHGFGDVNRYATTGAFIVQLWHGIPLKRIGLDSAETVRSGILPDSRLMRRVLGVLYRRTTRRIGLLPAASHLVRGRLESAFALTDERVRVTGEPRVDVLSQGSAEDRRRTARAAIERIVGSLPSASTRAVLYAPTWRDGEADPAIPSPAQWRRIVEVLDRLDLVLLVRSHPLGAGDYDPPFATDRVRGLHSAALPDATPILPGLDALVTDYSSMAFDAGLVPLPVLFLAPDADSYGARRGFYGRYSDVAGTDPATDWGALAEELEHVLDDPDAYAERVARSRALSERMQAFRDGRNTERVYGDILTGAGLMQRDGAEKTRANR